MNQNIAAGKIKVGAAESLRKILNLFSCLMAFVLFVWGGNRSH